MCSHEGRPTSIKRLFNKTIEEIITYGNHVLRGLINNNQGCSNFYKCSYIQYIVQFSIALTLARKYDISLKQVFYKFHKDIKSAYKNVKGIVKKIRLALFRSFKRDKKFFARWLTTIKKPIEYKYKNNNPLPRNYYICGTSHFHAMFLRKKIRLIKPLYTHIVKELVRINQRQICLCKECFDQVDNNLFEFNQITKRKLTKKWRVVHQRRAGSALKGAHTVREGMRSISFLYINTDKLLKIR